MSISSLWLNHPIVSFPFQTGQIAKALFHVYPVIGHTLQVWLVLLPYVPNASASVLDLESVLYFYSSPPLLVETENIVLLVE